MKFKIGDDVAVIDEDVKGKIISIEKNQVTFENIHGFSETYSASKLVKITAVLEKIESLELKEADFQKKKIIKKKATKKNDFIEVDLHIGHLVDYPKRLSNFEMLTIQLDTAQNTIEKVIKENVSKRIVFIHGHGQGVLKRELYKLFDRYAKQCHYFDASFQRYKQGATEVEFF
ncbi:MAG: DNA mismatch repair protein MutS [Flavobacteriales bacterium]